MNALEQFGIEYDWEDCWYQCDFCHTRLYGDNLADLVQDAESHVCPLSPSPLQEGTSQ